ncbi:MAG: hypothetical protein CVU47_10725 [Chloroflexi bacterium HGW-Chloroflexi-9]|nr:MAG: hypothetical protein CVU47_10725 [Chloroflexi bacterium HGW-Chloroflexi-9]
MPIATKTWTAGSVLPASDLNTYLRDVVAEIDPTAQGAGDVLYANAGLDGFEWLDASANPSKFLRFNAAGNALEAAEVPTIIAANAFEWQSAVATHYTAAFGAATIINSTPGDLLDFGWTAPSTPTIVDTNAGDFNSAADDDPPYLLCGTAVQGLMSPAIVGGYSRLQGVAKVLGTTPTTITVWFLVKFPNTANSANDIGFGLSSSASSTRVGAAGSIAIMCGATTFEYRLGTDAGVSLGVAIDTSWHLVEEVITVADGTVDIKIDGTERASNLAPASDLWPKRLFVEKNSVGGGGTVAVALCGVIFA